MQQQEAPVISTAGTGTRPRRRSNNTTTDSKPKRSRPFRIVPLAATLPPEQAQHEERPSLPPADAKPRVHIPTKAEQFTPYGPWDKGYALLSTGEVARILHCSESFLRKQRTRARRGLSFVGPGWVIFSSNAVRYRREAVICYLESLEEDER